MRILITGASGLLGSNLAVEAAHQGHIVFGIANANPPSGLSPLLSALTWLQTDLLAPGAVEQVLERTSPDWVIHCAALANLEACETDPELAFRLNSELPERLAHALQAYVARGGARGDKDHRGDIDHRLLHVSTDAVFDGARGNYTEADLPNPLGVYARSKLEGEQRVLAADPTAIVARVNLFGWSPSGKRSLAEFFFNNLSAGQPVNGFTDVFFCPLLANDLGLIFLEMLEKNLSGLYHTVSSESLSKYEFGLRIARRFGLDETLIQPISVAQAGLKAARSPNLTLHTHRLAAALGHPLPAVQPAIERFYALYQQGYPQQIQSLSSTH